jgi:pSer/pThr/pTyr-binding forkhead associated (FHA) protein
VARRHLVVERVGAGVVVRDLGSKHGACLHGIDLPRDRVPWEDGQLLALGVTTLELSDPLAMALDEIMAAPDAKMASSEYEQRPPTAPATPDQAVEVDEPPPDLDAEPHDDADNGDAFFPLDELADDGVRGVDIVVVLLALALLAVSAAGLAILL